MENRIVHKVSFGKGTHLISISYSERLDDKVLESDEMYSKQFKAALGNLRGAVQTVMKWDAKTMLVSTVDKIVFETEKKPASITFRASLADDAYGWQSFGVGMALRKLNENDFVELNGITVPSDYAKLTNCIEEIRKCCENYLEGERAEPEPELDFGA